MLLDNTYDFQLHVVVGRSTVYPQQNGVLLSGSEA